MFFSLKHQSILFSHSPFPTQPLVFTLLLSHLQALLSELMLLLDLIQHDFCSGSYSLEALTITLLPVILPKVDRVHWADSEDKLSWRPTSGTQDSRISRPSMPETTLWACAEGLSKPFSRGRQGEFPDGEKEVEAVSNEHEDDKKRSGGWLPTGHNRTYV